MLGDFIKGDLVRHDSFGIGRVEETSGFGEGQKVFAYFPGSEKSGWFGKDAVKHLEGTEKNAYALVKLAIKELRQEETPALELGAKWEGGEMILKPGQEGLAAHTVPIETFFHKIVMVRDRLRVMEQQINANQKLTDEEKVSLQQYITRIYGSLTTFNILFKNKNDQFVGQKGEK